MSDACFADYSQEEIYFLFFEYAKMNPDGAEGSHTIAANDKLAACDECDWVGTTDQMQSHWDEVWREASPEWFEARDAAFQIRFGRSLKKND